MKEINYKEMNFNPFNLIGGDWMLKSRWLTLARFQAVMRTRLQKPALLLSMQITQSTLRRLNWC